MHCGADRSRRPSRYPSSPAFPALSIYGTGSLVSPTLYFAPPLAPAAASLVARHRRLAQLSYAQEIPYSSLPVDRTHSVTCSQASAEFRPLLWRLREEVREEEWVWRGFSYREWQRE